MIEKQLNLSSKYEKFDSIKFSKLLRLSDSSYSPDSFENKLTLALTACANKIARLNHEDRIVLFSDLLKDCLLSSNTAKDFKFAELYLKHIKTHYDYNFENNIHVNHSLESNAKFVLGTILSVPKDSKEILPLCPILCSTLLSQMSVEDKKEVLTKKTLKKRVVAELGLIKKDLNILYKSLICTDKPLSEQLKVEKDNQNTKMLSEIHHKINDFFKYFKNKEIIDIAHDNYEFFDEKTKDKLFSVLELYSTCLIEAKAVDVWSSDFAIRYLNFLEDFELLVEARESFLSNQICSIKGLTCQAFENYDFGLANTLAVFLERQDDLNKFSNSIQEKLKFLEPKLKNIVETWIKEKTSTSSQGESSQLVLTEQEAKALSASVDRYFRDESFHLHDLHDSLKRFSLFIAEKDDHAMNKVYLLLKLTPIDYSSEYFSSLYNKIKEDLIDEAKTINKKISAVLEYGYEHLSYAEYESILTSHKAISFFNYNQQIVLLDLPHDFFEHKTFQGFIEQNSSKVERFSIVSNTDWLNKFYTSKYRASYRKAEVRSLVNTGADVSRPPKIKEQYRNLIINEGLRAELFNSYKEALGLFNLAFSIDYTSTPRFSSKLENAARKLYLFYKMQNCEEYHIELFHSIYSSLKSYLELPSNENYDKLIAIFNSQSFLIWQSENNYTLPSPTFV